MILPPVIGVCGPIGSGKDTASNMLIDQYQYIQVSFAETLKDVLAPLFGWDRELLEGKTPESRKWRNEIDVYWSAALGREFTPRDALREIGTDLFRDHFSEDIWINSIRKRILSKYSYDKIIFSDCRFPNEIQLVKDLGGVIIELQPKEVPSYYKLAEVINERNIGINHFEEAFPDIHISEWAWIGVNNPDFVIVNDGSLEDLNIKIKNVFG